MQVSVLEFTDEAGCPLYHLEHYIEGDYVKYNSNSGFVSDITRNTPQAFSHFTFERSGHQLIVVDIQGVGDLYTDPQIHTVRMRSVASKRLLGSLCMRVELWACSVVNCHIAVQSWEEWHSLCTASVCYL
uniref:Alpha-type protein kinase domain-containing protein n=1 Tax=Parascaris equorum TaxID=6256 RepID=A0A914RRH0_PAREQ